MKKNQKTDALKVNMAAYQVLIFVMNIKKIAENFQCKTKFCEFLAVGPQEKYF